MKPILTSLTALFLFAGASVASAEQPGGPDMHGVSNLHLAQGSSTMAHKGDLKMGSTTPALPPAVLGTVTTVSANSFTIAARLKGATTTVTVNVTDSTVFHFASTTASLSSLSAGTRVAVMGPVSTSTATIAARMVIIVPGEGQGEHGVQGMMDDRGMHMASGTASGTPRDWHASSTPHGIGNWIKSFFGRGKGGDASNGGPAAASSSVGSFLHSLFGWL